MMDDREEKYQPGTYGTREIEYLRPSVFPPFQNHQLISLLLFHHSPFQTQSTKQQPTTINQDVLLQLPRHLRHLPCLGSPLLCSSHCREKSHRSYIHYLSNQFLDYNSQWSTHKSPICQHWCWFDSDCKFLKNMRIDERFLTNNRASLQTSLASSTLSLHPLPSSLPALSELSAHSLLLMLLPSLLLSRL